MSSYVELKEQADALLRQAEEIRKQEIAQVVSGIRKTMADYGLTVEDIGGRKATIGKRSGKSDAVDKVVLYRGPNGETWSGGPGRRPQWVKDVVASGGDIEQYRLTQV
jgi:DNA-binding protein H-NS